MQYIIPDNIAALISNLTNSDTKNDSRIVAYSSVYAKLIAAITETSKTLENDPSWFINTHWRVIRPTAIDRQNSILIPHSTDMLIEESENNDIRKSQLLTQPKILSELPDELISGSRSVATVSSEIVLESENITDAAKIQIVTTTDNYVSVEHNVAHQLDQLNNFPIIDSDSSFSKGMSNDGHTLHDSGFISGKGITNT